MGLFMTGFCYTLSSNWDKWLLNKLSGKWYKMYAVYCSKIGYDSRF